MPSRYPTLPTLLAVVFLIICVAWPFSAPVEAKDKKGRAASRKQISSSRSKSSNRKGRSSARRKGHRSKNFAEYEMAAVPASYPVAPDRIEVIESGAESSSELKRYLNPPLPRTQTQQDSSEPETSVPVRRKGVNIDQSRVIQIQQALNQRGFYFGEMSGDYDATTIEAMRRFQASQKISATGYPTAHALKRLGL